MWYSRHEFSFSCNARNISFCCDIRMLPGVDVKTQSYIVTSVSGSLNWKLKNIEIDVVFCLSRTPVRLKFWLCAKFCTCLLGWKIYWHIETETKWTPFRRRHFEVHFFVWKCLNSDWNFIEVLFLRVQLTIFQHWFRLSEPMMIRLPTHICVTRPQWVNSSFTSKQLPIYWQHTPVSRHKHLAVKCL